MKGSGVLGAFLQQEEATKILACQIPVSFLSWVENLSTLLMLFDRYKKLQALLVPLRKQSRILLNDLWLIQ